jgi:ankyrin repeat protein
MERQRWETIEEILTIVPRGSILPGITIAGQQTALHLAIEFQASTQIWDLLFRVLNLDEANRPDKYGDTPLHLACRYGTPIDILTKLVRHWPGACISSNRFDRTPLDDLFLRNNDDDDETFDDVHQQRWNLVTVITILLDSCKDAIHHLDQSGKTLLHRVLNSGTSDALHTKTLCCLLLERKPELANILDHHGVSPLLEACKRDDSLEIVREFRARCQQPIESIQDSEGCTALHYAIYWGASNEIIRELLAESPKLLSIRDTKGKTPMDYLVSYYDTDFSTITYRNGWHDALHHILETITAFFENGPHRNVTRDGDLLLHAALYNKECPMPIIEFLIACVSDQVKERDGLENYPIHLVSQIEWVDELYLQSYQNVIAELLKQFPEGARAVNGDDQNPISLMIQAGRSWQYGIKQLIEVHPASIYNLHLNGGALYTLLSKLDRSTMYQLLQEVPYILDSSVQS